jgi:trans-aconitate methyltransferase
MDQSEIWDALVGDSWVRYASEIDEHSRPFGEAALDALGDITGARALDVGCGTGSTSRALRDRGASKVVGVDLSQRMIDHALATNDDDAVSFVATDVNSLIGHEPFDVVYSRFGVMFFDDAVSTFAHLRSLTRDAGRLAFCAWTDPFTNPWMLEPMMASVGVIGPPDLPGPGEPGPFSLGTPELADDVLSRSGWSVDATRTVSVEGAHSAGNADSMTDMVMGNVPPLAQAVAEHPELDDELRAAISAALRVHERDGAVVLGASALVVAATVS